MNMFGIGTPELILIIVLALLIIGPKDLPRVGRELGRIFKSFQSAINSIESEIHREVKGLEDQNKREDIKNEH